MEQEARLSMKMEANHDRAVQLMSEEIAKSSEQVSSDMSRMVQDLRSEHASKFQGVHEELVSVRTQQATLSNMQDDLRAEVLEKCDGAEASMAANLVNPLRREFSDAMAAKDADIANIKAALDKVAPDVTAEETVIPLQTQLNEQAELLRKNTEQCSSLRSRLDYFEKKQAGVDRTLSTLHPPLPPANAQVTYASVASCGSSTSVPPASTTRQPIVRPGAPTSVPRHGLYYGSLAREATPPVHLNVGDVPPLPPYPDGEHSVFKIELL